MAKGLVIVSSVVVMAVLAFSGCATMSKVETPKFVLRVNCASTEPYTDMAGNLWLVDQVMEEDKAWGFVDGMTIDRGDLGIIGTDAPKIYETERYSMSAYEFKVPNGKYTVRLHFAETYDGITGDGQRIFSITINEKTVLEDFDPYKEAGGFQKPVVKTINSLAVTNESLTENK
jgi:endoglucanase